MVVHFTLRRLRDSNKEYLLISPPPLSSAPSQVNWDLLTEWGDTKKHHSLHFTIILGIFRNSLRKLSIKNVVFIVSSLFWDTNWYLLLLDKPLNIWTFHFLFFLAKDMDSRQKKTLPKSLWRNDLKTFRIQNLEKQQLISDWYSWHSSSS